MWIFWCWNGLWGGWIYRGVNLSDKKNYCLWDKNKPGILFTAYHSDQFMWRIRMSYQIEMWKLKHLARASANVEQMILRTLDQLYLRKWNSDTTQRMERLMPPHLTSGAEERWMIEIMQRHSVSRLSWMYGNWKIQIDMDQLYTLLQNAMKNKSIIVFSEWYQKHYLCKGIQISENFRNRLDL